MLAAIIAVGLVLALWVSVRLLTPVVCRRLLHGHVGDARVSFFPPGVEMKRVQVQSAGSFASADAVEARLEIADLLAGRVRFQVRVRGANLTVSGGATALPDWSARAFGISELVIADAEVSVDRFRFHDISVRVTNLATRRELHDCEPSILTVDARIQDAAVFTLRADVSAWLVPPVFSATAQLVGLPMEGAMRGTFDCIVALNAARGELSAALRPSLRDVGRNEGESLPEVTTIVPMSRHLDDGRVWTALLTTLRTAFSDALASAVAALPPEPAMSRAALLVHFSDEPAPTLHS